MKLQAKGDPKAPHVKQSLLSPRFAFAKSVNREFSRLDEELGARGFLQLPLGASPLANKNERIYNRQGGSNYFVFVRLEDEALQVMFTNPGTSKEDASAPSGRVRMHRATVGKSDGWARRVAEEIAAESAKKPLTTYYSVVHDHIGYVGVPGRPEPIDMRASGFDDGKSHDFEAVRNFMLWNYDVHMGPTSHNYWSPKLYEAISGLEAQAGIVNVPGVELTLPYKLGAKNGPHLCVWFANEKAASFFWDEVLSHGNWEYAPFAPLVAPDKILSTLDGMAERKEAASGVNHFMASHLLPGVGFGNRMAMGDYDWKYVDEMMRCHFNAIEAFNLGNPAGQGIKFSPEGMKNRADLLKMVEEAGFGGRALTPNLMCLAAAKYFSGKYGKWAYVGHDTHEYFDVRFDRYTGKINRPGRAFNALDLGWLNLAEGRKPFAEEIMGVLLSQKAGQTIMPFVPVEYSASGKVDIVASRKTDGLLDKVYEFYSNLGTWAKMFPAMWHDFLDGAKSVMR